MSEETVRIEHCPHCRGAHVYRLEVERAIALTVVTRKRREKPTKVKTTQLFICPLQNEQYRASLILEDTSSDRIRAVTVIGLASVRS
ncbi:MAG TPA: hypothetical protein VKF36_06880 [Syntrophorhabdales bacterium]|nr:hypothetical protein [Syntrophorhabdales bacterium]